MSEQSAEERTEAPTPRKLQEASDEGRVARSQELATATLLLGAAGTFTLLAPDAGRTMLAGFGASLGRIGSAADAPNTLLLLQHAGRNTLTAVIVLCAATTALALGVGAIQARGTFTATPLAPKWSRVSPLANAKNLFSSRAPVELLKSLLKIGIVAVVAGRELRRAWPEMIDLGARDAASLLETLSHAAGRLLLFAGIAFLFLAALDYAFQLWQHAKQLRMTKDEVKREGKQSDGDPVFKSRIRAVARARLRRRMLQDVVHADVVIVNPTSRAVALRYDPLLAPAPVVLAMGERKIAERIKEIAREHDIPMIENRPLAIALLASARVGVMIPAELYVAVAEILAFVFRRRARAGVGPSWSGAEDV